MSNAVGEQPLPGQKAVPLLNWAGEVVPDPPWQTADVEPAPVVGNDLGLAWVPKMLVYSPAAHQ